MIFLKVCIELLPYIFMARFIILIWYIQKKPIFQTVGFSKDRIGKQFLNCIIIFMITSATLVLNETFGIEKVKLEGDIGDILHGIDTSNIIELNMDLIKENN